MCFGFKKLRVVQTAAQFRRKFAGINTKLKQQLTKQTNSVAGDRGKDSQDRNN
jgi:hypothetical protein